MKALIHLKRFFLFLVLSVLAVGCLGDDDGIDVQYALLVFQRYDGAGNASFAPYLQVASVGYIKLSHVDVNKGGSIVTGRISNNDYYYGTYPYYYDVFEKVNGNYTVTAYGTTGETESASLSLKMEESEILGNIDITELNYVATNMTIYASWEEVANATEYGLLTCIESTDELGFPVYYKTDNVYIPAASSFLSAEQRIDFTKYKDGTRIRVTVYAMRKLSDGNTVILEGEYKTLQKGGDLFLEDVPAE